MTTTGLRIPDIADNATTLDAALAYADAGWYVLPVAAGTKNPGSVVGTQWPAKSSRDPEQIIAWWAGTDHGIALHVGRSGAIVFDVDHYEHVPDELLVAIETTDCPHQSTRPDEPGRGHYVFANHLGRRVGNGLGALKTSPAWGEIRGAGGVIIAAPTPHPGGGRYHWERTGTVPPIPDYLADALPGARAPEDTASDIEVAQFLDAHTASARPEALRGLVTALTAKLRAGASCHMSTLGVLVDAMAEAAAGMYPARDAVRALWAPFAATATSGTSTGRALTYAEARREYAGIVAWAVGQAEELADEARERVEAVFGPPLPPPEPPADWCDRAVGEWRPGEEATGNTGGAGQRDEATTWEAIPLGPYLRGEVTVPQPSVGLARSDGQRLLYPGREHAVLGETESGKTWFALGCAAAELVAGNDVVYIHFEESDPYSTVERLQLLGVGGAIIAERLHFVAPTRPARPGWVAGLAALSPTLVILDGVNEAMALHGADILAAEGVAAFRRALVVPFTRAGAAVLGCDHLPMVRVGSRRDAYGSVHKGNALDGARIVLENAAPFGRGMRGRSNVFVTKDRPGHLRSHGEPTKVAGKCFFGTLVVDASDPFNPLELVLYAPNPSTEGGGGAAADGSDAVMAMAETVHAVLCGQPNGEVGSARDLVARVRAAGHPCRDSVVRDAAAFLVATGRAVEVPGKHRAVGYRAVSSAAAGSREEVS